MVAYSDSMDCKTGLVPVAKCCEFVQFIINFNNITTLYRGFIEKRFSQEKGNSFDWSDWKVRLCWVTCNTPT